MQFDPDIFDYKKSNEAYAVWVKSLMERFGYKTRRALFKGMMSCSAEHKEGVLTIVPMHHEKLEAWRGAKGDGVEDVVVSADSSPGEVGAALRLALSRCTG